MYRVCTQRIQISTTKLQAHPVHYIDNDRYRFVGLNNDDVMQIYNTKFALFTIVNLYCSQY